MRSVFSMLHRSILTACFILSAAVATPLFAAATFVSQLGPVAGDEGIIRMAVDQRTGYHYFLVQTSTAGTHQCALRATGPHGELLGTSDTMLSVALPGTAMSVAAYDNHIYVALAEGSTGQNAKVVHYVMGPADTAGAAVVLPKALTIQPVSANIPTKTNVNFASQDPVIRDLAVNPSTGDVYAAGICRGRNSTAPPSSPTQIILIRYSRNLAKLGQECIWGNLAWDKVPDVRVQMVGSSVIVGTSFEGVTRDSFRMDTRVFPPQWKQGAGGSYYQSGSTLYSVNKLFLESLTEALSVAGDIPSTGNFSFYKNSTGGTGLAPYNLTTHHDYLSFAELGMATGHLSNKVAKAWPFATEMLKSFTTPITSTIRLTNFVAYGSGFVTVPKTGIYTFVLTVQDGARLYIDGRSNDGNGGPNWELDAGPHVFSSEGRDIVARKQLHEGTHRIDIEFYAGKQGVVSGSGDNQSVNLRQCMQLWMAEGSMDAWSSSRMTLAVPAPVISGETIVGQPDLTVGSMDNLRRADYGTDARGGPVPYLMSFTPVLNPLAGAPAMVPDTLRTLPTRGGPVRDIELSADGSLWVLQSNNFGAKLPATITRVNNAAGLDLLGTATLQSGTSGASDLELDASSLVSPGPAKSGIIVAGRFGAGTLRFVNGDRTVTAQDRAGNGGRSVYLAQLGTDLKWTNPPFTRFPDTSPPPQLRPVAAEFNSATQQLSLAGSTLGGALQIGTEQVPDAGGFLAFADSGTLHLAEQITLAVNIKAERRTLSGTDFTVDVPVAVTDVKPWVGKNRGRQDLSYVVKVPEHIYIRRNGQALQQEGNPNFQSAIESDDVVTRFTPVSYTVNRDGENTTLAGNGNTATVVLNSSTTVTFSCKTEHRLQIKSLIDGVDAGERRNSGNPEPPAGVHWVEENHIVSPFIDGTAVDTAAFNRRLRTDGYDITGSVPASVTWLESELTPRQQVKEFAMTGPVSVQYRLKTQYGVSVGTSSSVSKDLPVIKVLTPAGAADRAGSGTFWFDRGVDVFVGATDGTQSGQSLAGVLSSLGSLAEASGKTRGALVESSPGSKVLGLRLLDSGTPGIKSGASITWNYGDKIYRQITSIGAPVELVAGSSRTAPEFPLYDMLTAAVIDQIDTRSEPRVTSVLNAPPGSGPSDMHVWDQVSFKSWPVRPGRFLLEWKQKAPATGVVITEIVSGFPGEEMPPIAVVPGYNTGTKFRRLTDAAGAERVPGPDYRMLLHEDMPPVKLDPVATDAFGFYKLAASYQPLTGGKDPAALQVPAVLPQISETGEMLVPVTAGNLSPGAGRHVLVMTKAPSGAATGDITRENLLVRVLETRPWDAASGWTNAVPAVPMLINSTSPAVIGARLTDNTYDKAQLRTGFIVHENARYNPDIYDRLAADAAGPIIPVNRSTGGQDLVVVWYERSDGVLWPWQSVRYDPVWPVPAASAPAAGTALPGGRIVIASRLGSDGLNKSTGTPATWWAQAPFDTTRYSEVKLYNQPDRTLPGFNPNEEHALLAPSLRFASAVNPPPAAFALRAGDLNVTSADAAYTSDPYVLVQYLDIAADEMRMAVFQTVKEDTGLGVAAVSVTGSNISLSSDGTNSLTFTSTGHPLVNGEVVELSFDGALEGVASGSRYFVNLSAPAGPFTLATLPGLPGVAGVPLAAGQTRPPVVVKRVYPHIFKYEMKAGEPVQAPYPLGLVIGLTPSPLSKGSNGWGEPDDPTSPARTYWEDYRGQAWSVSGGSPTQAGRLRSFFYYPMQSGFWFERDGAQVPAGQFLRFLPPDMASIADIGKEFVPVSGRGDPQTVKYSSTWPASVPVLKAGETLTYAGGEYKADNPSAVGLPGVIGWASGRVVFDSRNPTMANTPAAAMSYGARLIAPLENRSVNVLNNPLTASDRTALNDIGPAAGFTEAEGVIWRLAGLSASLKKRIALDPLTGKLTLNGFINDKTLGDSTLTAVPPPVYVLEPNVLTRRDYAELLNAAHPLTGVKLADKLPATKWKTAVDNLFIASRDPNRLGPATFTNESEVAYNVGVELDAYQENGGDKLDGNGRPVTVSGTARHQSSLGPGLALIPGPALLEKGVDTSVPLYVTVAENDDQRIAGPVTLHIIRIDPSQRYRGAVKTVLAENVFEEKITLRHSGDFGGNTDDLVYQWYYREEDGTDAVPLPPAAQWKLFVDPNPAVGAPGGLGMYQLDVKGSGGLILADNLFLVRYRHRSDSPVDGDNGVNWASAPVTEWQKYGQLAAKLDADGNPVRGTDGKVVQEKQGQWAGAANSPTVDGVFRPQLVSGWVKRVVDRINPYEARIDDFTNSGAPATYVSMIQQLGQKHVGAVALNSQKDVIENVGLIELYQTILDRAVSLSIGLSQPISTDGVNNAIQLAATRLSDFYMLLGNEAYSDAQDSTVGFGSASAEYGSAASSLWTFMNQTGSPLDERLALLRGVADSAGRPVYNRLMWNFTGGAGEAAYAMSYSLSDENGDGFINEQDAMLRYPQGHGDAWGHYTTALRTHYRLLQHPYFRWQSRSELLNMQDVVIPVDYYDERKFASAAAARAKAGAEIVAQTYRARYVENVNGQWQGYTDTDQDRGWGVQDWARRAGQGAYVDWLTANAILPAVDDAHGAVAEVIPGDAAIRQVDRTTVPALREICTEFSRIETSLANADSGLNPLGLASDAVPFDIDPLTYAGAEGTARTGHFQQIFDRAVKAALNARTLFDVATAHQNNLRRQQDSADTLAEDVASRDRDYRNRLIAIFGTPYEGLIGTGKPYPAGYEGPDLYYSMYVPVRSVDATTVPAPAADSDDFKVVFDGMRQQIVKDGSSFNKVIDALFFNDTRYGTLYGESRETAIVDHSSLQLKLPIRAQGYAFEAPAAWGKRASTGELQSLISDLVQAEAELALAVDDYNGTVDEIKDAVELLKIQHGVGVEAIEVLTKGRDRYIKIAKIIAGLEGSAMGFNEISAGFEDTMGLLEGAPEETIVGMAFGGDFAAALKQIGAAGFLIGKASFRAAGTAASMLATSLGPQLETENFDVAINDANLATKYEIQQQLVALRTMLGGEGPRRVAVFKAVEALRSVSDAYRTKLNEGVALIQERQDFNISTAGAVQQLRYQDMAFRVFRNDALAAYRNAFDLAARYAWLAARAYDYETNLDPSDAGSAQGVLESIMKAETLGTFNEEGPLAGSGGLADALARMQHNFLVLNGQLGLNNAQSEGSKISLRYELFRIPLATTSDAAWKQKLATYKVADLWQVPEFRRYCRPFAPESAGAQPGLVIPFGTQVVAGRNVFGWPLGGNDNAFDPSLFATRVRAAGVWFTNYDSSRLSLAPRVYLVPAGVDRMTVPTSGELKVRSWNILDQRIPVPWPISSTAVNLPSFVPLRDSLDGQIAEVRRYSSFRAYGDTGAIATDDQMTFDSRLIGRSVWNTRWVLIVPAAGLSAEAGVDKLVDGDAGWSGIRDITLYFKTFGFSGN